MGAMSDGFDMRAFSRPARLRDGTPVLIRAIRPDDRQRIIDAFSKLDPETVYTRFFSMKKSLSDADLARIDASDFVHAAALVATIGEGADETIIGAGGYTVLESDAPGLRAEVSFTIEEDYHGQGLATLFMALLIEIGRRRGIQCFEAEVLAANPAMLKVFKRCGLPIVQRSEDGVVFVEMLLGPPANAQPKP